MKGIWTFWRGINFKKMHQSIEVVVFSIYLGYTGVKDVFTFKE